MRILMMMMEGRGGMYQYGVLLSNALSHEHEIHAIVPRGAEVGFFEPSVNVREYPVGDTPRNFLPRLMRVDRMVRLLRLIRRVRPDVIHFHNPYNPWPTPLLPWLRRYRIVTTIPEGKLHRGMEKRLEMVVSRAIHVRFSDALIVLFEKDSELLGGLTKNKRTFIIPHGVNTLFARMADIDVPEDNSILFFGAALPFKGLEYLLKAFAIVKDAVLDVKLVVASRLDMEKYAPLLEPLGDRVVVDNRFIPPEVAAKYLRATKLVVLPYIEDDHSGLIPLVYSFGKPVVVTELVSDMVEPGKTGLVVPPFDHLALARAITTLLQDECLRADMKTHVRKKVEGELSWERIAEKTCRVYREVLKTQRGNGPSA